MEMKRRKGSEKMGFKLSTSMFHYDEGKSVKRASSFVSKDEREEFSHPASACDPEKNTYWCKNMW